MNEESSFYATIAYGWLALIGLLLAGLWTGATASVYCALLASGAAYLSQLATTWALSTNNERVAVAALSLQIASVGLWLAGVLAL